MVNRSVIASLGFVSLVVLAAACDDGGGGDGPAEGVVVAEHVRPSIDQLGEISAAMAAMNGADVFQAVLAWGHANNLLVAPGAPTMSRTLFPRTTLPVVPNTGTATCTGTSCAFDGYGIAVTYNVFTLTGAITRAGDVHTFDLTASFTAHFDRMAWELDGAVAITAAGVDGTVRNHGTGELGPLGEQVSPIWDVAVDYNAITLDAQGCPIGGALHAAAAYDDGTDGSFHVEGSLAFGPGCSAAR